MNEQHLTPASAFALALYCTLALLGCERNEYTPPPPPEVTVAHPIEREVTTYNEFSARTDAVAAVEVRARVQGFLKSIHFVSGGEVKQGDLLFVIEPDLYESRVARAAADLESAEALSRAGEEQLGITRAIYERKAGSRADLVAKTQARDQAKAAVAQAKAALDAAKLDLSYTKVFAPIPGRIDRNYVDVGNLVGGSEATRLATIVQLDPIYAYFDVSERDLLVYRELRRRGGVATREGERAAAYMGLATDEGFPYEGEVDYVRDRVDPATGTMEVRAVFPNPNRVVIPGLFARVRVPFTRERAIVVPEDALSTDQGGRFALVVVGNDVVEMRRIEAGALVDGERIVKRGLSTEDRVVVNGLQRARPGSAVKPLAAPKAVVEAREQAGPTAP